MEKGALADGRRLVFLDNLRTFLIFLVVLNHAGIVYESSGFFAPFWLVDDPATNDVVGLVNALLDIFVMPALFFVSGYLAPRSVGRRPGPGYVASRFRRLMLPWLVAVLTLMPVYKVIFLYSRGLPQEDWTTYFHFSNGVISQNWLWFLPVLFLFDVVFWLLAKVPFRLPEISLRSGVAMAMALGVIWGFAISMLGLSGWTKTALIDFQNEKLLVYFLIFLLGALCWKLRVFDAPIPRRKGWYIVAASTAWIPVNVYVIVLLSLLFRPGEYFVSAPVDVLILWVSFQVSLLLLLYLLLSTFRFWFDRQGERGRVLAANSYGVYVIHVPVLGAIALLMLGIGIPSLLKYAILTVVTWTVCNGAVFGYRALVTRRKATRSILEPVTQ